MSKKATIIVMDRLPNGRKPITISSITCDGYILFSRDMDGKMHMRMHDTDEALMGMIGCIRTMGQLDKLREAIRKHVEMYPEKYRVDNRDEDSEALAIPKPTAYTVKAGALEKMEQSHTKEERKQQAKEIEEFAKVFEERNMKE